MLAVLDQCSKNPLAEFIILLENFLVQFLANNPLTYQYNVQHKLKRLATASKLMRKLQILQFFLTLLQSDPKV